MDRYKYPRTYHLPFSPGKSDDDKVLYDLSYFEGKEVVVTEKMDGENTTIYPDGYCHARSIDSANHPSRSWVKQLASYIGPQMKEATSKVNWRITGENLFAKHSIYYDDLKSYFYVFGMWENDICLEWNFTEEIAERLGLITVPVLYRGKFDELYLRSLAKTLGDNQEGFVVRLAENIYPSEWEKSVAKWVRPNHVQTDEHWMNQQIVKNSIYNK